jgi:predicted anti-sigma-YlaC factor YlaD
MHAVTMENLEDYLAGTLEAGQLRDIEAHLGICGACREEIRGMQEVSGLFGALRRDESESWAVGPGFTAKVLEQVSRRKPVPAFASFFAWNAAFGQRLVFASLLTLAVLGGYLVTRESKYTAGPSAEAILAQQNEPGFETQRAEDNMLVRLTAYEH